MIVSNIYASTNRGAPMEILLDHNEAKPLRLIFKNILGSFKKSMILKLFLRAERLKGCDQTYVSIANSYQGLPTLSKM